MCFRHGQFLTVDEQFLPLESRCPFIQYIARNPEKFGIKFWFLVDLETKFMLNSFPYLGKDCDKTDYYSTRRGCCKKIDPTKIFINVFVPTIFLHLVDDFDDKSSQLGSIQESRNVPIGIDCKR